MRMFADLCSFLKPGSGTALFLVEEMQITQISVPGGSRKRLKGRMLLIRKDFPFGLRKHHKVLKPRGLTMHQYRTLVYRSIQGGVFEGSLGQAKYVQIGLYL